MKKIAIVCGSPSSEFLAPFEDKSWEIWVLGNRVNRFIEKNLRFDRIFEIHDDLSEHGDIKTYVNYIANLKVPFLVGENFPMDLIDFKSETLNFIIFDFEKSKELFGQEYLTSSSAYMMSQAILEGATDIAIYGVDMAVDDHEYFWQRSCMEAWIGFAKGKGINITIPDVSAIGKCSYVEGRNCGGKPEFKQPPFTEDEFLKMAELHKKEIEKLNQQIVQAESKIHSHDGAVQVYNRLAKVARATEAGIKLTSLSDTNSIK